jgi:cyclopropane fatty-acyl-phospholipid synthase-like methyltransferase
MEDARTATAPGQARLVRRVGPARADVQAYWDRAHDAYLTSVGTTFQAGRITTGASMRESNLWLAQSAGLAAGQCVLDAGCGVCGPAVDIVREIAGLRIVGITLVQRQARGAAALIAQAGVSDRVHVVHGDYHALPFADRSFDAVLFLESIGYAAGFVPLFERVRRVLKPGGSLYVKDVFRHESLWSDQESEELAEFDDTYAQETPALRECAEAAAAAGFTDLRTRDLTSLVSTAHGARAMFDAAGRQTAFGRLHYRRHGCLPVYFAELIARAPR